MKANFAFAALVAAAYAYDNSVPIYGSNPGWIEGKGKAGIKVEIFLDLLCSDCKAENPVWEQLLEQPFLDGSVYDYFTFSFTVFPLPYHYMSFEVNQLISFFMDECTVNSTKCGLASQYKDFAFANQSTILGMKDDSKDWFTQWWSTQVANEFGYDFDTIYGLYDRSTDAHQTFNNTRYFWKYACQKKVSGTPTAFINGVMLDSVPRTVDGWLRDLESIYNSQYAHSNQAMEFLS